MNISKYSKDFWNTSVIFLPSLFEDQLIEETKSYLNCNETRIISTYRHDSRKLVLDIVNDKEFVKYFELPLSENFPLFGQYISSNVLQIVSAIMKEDIRLVSIEVHSRNPGGSHIPLHQDNAYYGLKKGNACTLFIPLSVSYFGNLKYIPNVPGVMHDHERSNAQAFSLQVSHSKRKSSFSGLKIIQDHTLGGAFLHHSHSLHFATNVPKNAERVWAVRMTFFGSKTDIKEGHLEWYNEVVSKNRDNARL